MTVPTTPLAGEKISIATSLAALPFLPSSPRLEAQASGIQSPELSFASREQDNSSVHSFHETCRITYLRVVQPNKPSNLDFSTTCYYEYTIFVNRGG